jgi:hypothetical protein
MTSRGSAKNFGRPPLFGFAIRVVGALAASVSARMPRVLDPLESGHLKDYGAAAITVSAVFLNPIAILLGLKAQWGKTPAS